MNSKNKTEYQRYPSGYQVPFNMNPFYLDSKVGNEIIFFVKYYDLLNILVQFQTLRIWVEHYSPLVQKTSGWNSGARLEKISQFIT